MAKIGKFTVTSPVQITDQECQLLIQKEDLPEGVQYLEFWSGDIKLPHHLELDATNKLSYYIKVNLNVGDNTFDIYDSLSETSDPQNVYPYWADCRIGVPTGWTMNSIWQYSQNWNGIVTGAYFYRVAGITAYYNGTLALPQTLFPNLQNKWIDMHMTVNRITGGSGDGDNKGLYFYTWSGPTAYTTATDGINGAYQAWCNQNPQQTQLFTYTSRDLMPYPAPVFFGWYSGSTHTQSYWYDITQDRLQESTIYNRTRNQLNNISIYSGGEQKVLHWLRLRNPSVGETVTYTFELVDETYGLSTYNNTTWSEIVGSEYDFLTVVYNKNKWFGLIDIGQILKFDYNNNEISNVEIVYTLPNDDVSILNDPETKYEFSVTDNKICLNLIKDD